MKQLQDRVAIVTGSNSGLGRAIAESFAAEGAKVVLAARRKEALDEVAAGIKAKGGIALAVPTDVTKEAEVIALFKTALDAFSRVDILVNNAGVARGAPIEDLMLKTWQESDRRESDRGVPVQPGGGSHHEEPRRRPHHQHGEHFIARAAATLGGLHHEQVCARRPHALADVRRPRLWRGRLGDSSGRGRNRVHARRQAGPRARRRKII